MSTQKPTATVAGSLEEVMADAWKEFSSHCVAVREKQGLLWNRTNSLDLLNMFLSIHDRLTRSLSGEYCNLERRQVEEALDCFKNGQFVVAEKVPVDLGTFPDSQRSAFCWKHILASYCRIHGRLKVELRGWNQDDHREFESTIWNLLTQLRV